MWHIILESECSQGSKLACDKAAAKTVKSKSRFRLGSAATPCLYSIGLVSFSSACLSRLSHACLTACSTTSLPIFPSPEPESLSDLLPSCSVQTPVTCCMMQPAPGCSDMWRAQLSHQMYAWVRDVGGHLFDDQPSRNGWRLVQRLKNAGPWCSLTSHSLEHCFLYIAHQTSCHVCYRWHNVL